MAAPGESKALDTSSVISDAHVREVLRADKGEEAELLTWHTQDFTDKGDNYATVVTRLNINYSLNGHQDTTSCIVKINPHRGLFASFPEFISTLFKKEAGFYSELAQALSLELMTCGMSALRMPKFLSSDLDNPHELVFLEDLAPRGFRMYDRKKGMDVAHTLLVVQELARLHAASLLLQAKTPQDLADKHPFLKPDWTTFTSNGRDFVKTMLDGNLAISLEIMKMVGGHRKAEEWIANAKENVADVLETQLQRKSPFEVLCHGDCWNNNTLFRYNSAGEPEEVMLVDLQVCRVASPATDLAYLLFTSLNGDTRMTKLHHFLAVYHKTFSAILEAADMTIPFTLHELTQEFKDKEEYGIIFGTLSIFVILSDKSEVPDVDNMKEEDIPKMIEETHQKTIEKMNNNTVFRSRFLGLYDSMKDD